MHLKYVEELKKTFRLTNAGNMTANQLNGSMSQGICTHYLVLPEQVNQGMFVGGTSLMDRSLKIRINHVHNSVRPV